MDIATLGLRIDNSQAVAGAKSLDTLAASGARAESAYLSLTARNQDFARAGANAAQIAQLTGASMKQASAAVKEYAGTVSQATIDMDGLKAAQAQMAYAGIKAGEAMEVASAGMNTAGLGLGRLRMGFTSLVAQMSGVNPVMARLGGTIAVLGAGMLPVIGALAALAAGMEIWKAWHEEANTAAKAQSDLAEAARKWNDAQRDNGTFEMTKQLHAATEEAKKLHAELDKIASGSLVAAASAVGAGGSKIAAWIRVLTSGDLMAMTSQFGIEAAKGTASITAQAKGDDAAAAAEKAHVATVQRDADLKALRDRMTDIQDGYESLVVPTNAVTASLQKQGDQLRAATQTANDMSVASENDARLAQVTGVAHELLAARIKAENEQRAANLKYANDPAALTIMTAQIQASYDQAKATILVIDRQKELTQATVDGARIAKANAAAIQNAAKADQQIIGTMVKDVQRDFSSFFDSVLTKGVTSFRALFDEIRGMFSKMLADMAAADLMKKIAGPLSSTIAGIMGTASIAGAQSSGGTVSIGGITMPAPKTSALPGGGAGMLASIGKGLGEAGIGFGIGSLIGSQTTNTTLGALGGAAGGAASGFAMGGPVGAIIGGAAGLVGGFLGARHSAEAAAKALLAMQMAAAQTHATLADWRAEISHTAADQKAAAEADLKWKYLSIRQTIEQVEAGKKMEEQRNKDLAEADSIYALAQKNLANSTNGLTDAMNGAINAVSGYRYQSLYFQSMPFQAPTSSAPGGPATSGGTGNSGGTTGTGSGGAPIVVNLVLPDGTTLSKVVLKGLKATAQRQFGDTSRWSEVQ